MRKLTTEEFIVKAKSVHGDRYDYSKVVYVKNLDKVVIICKDHGEFKQSPDSHFHKNGCPSCACTGRSSTKDFILKAQSIHHNKYDYSKVNYITSLVKVVIICKEHGEFTQTPGMHLSGRGCLDCGLLKISNSLLSSTKDFIIKAKEVHGNKYNYANVDYISCKDDIDIICHKHGIFKQSPNKHLQGHGCTKCTSGISNKEIKWVELFNNVNIKHCTLTSSNKYYFVDGYDETTNTVYEFYGNFWHGNPRTHNQEEMNTASKKTFGELYQATIQRENELKALGYNLVTIWEDEFDNLSAKAA